MIAHLSGTFFEKSLGFCIIQMPTGIGYQVFMPQRSIEKYQKNDAMEVYIFHRVKEDQNDLYGFESSEEKEFFEKLISVSGVGPKTALLILEFSPQMIRKAIEEEDVKFLSQAKGMGKKTVSRLILELKGKLPDLSDTDAPENSDDQAPVSQKFLACGNTLESLGFERKAIQEMFKNSGEALKNSSEEEIIKFGLRELSGG